MAAPLSLHHIRLPFSSDNPILHNKPTTSTTIAAAPITTATKTSRTNNPIEPHPCLTLLDKCSTMSELKQIHAQLLRTGLFFDAFTASKVVAFSALEGSGSLHYARLVLTQIPNPTTYTCNSVIRGYTNKDLPREAIFFYQEMIIQGWVPDRFTFPSLFKSCGDLWEGKQLHCHSTKLGFVSDSYIQNTLMNMYSNCGCLISARKVFDKMLDKSVVSWATMIDAYAQWDQPIEAVKLFDKMESESVDPNEVTLVNVLTACAKARDLKMAKRVHQYIEEYGFGNHLKLNTALMDVYCKCECVLLARDLFDKMPEKNLFSWNIMINGHVEDSNYDEAFLLFREMQLKGEKGDKVTMVSLLLACSHLGALELGKWLHAYIEKEKIEVDVALGTTLVDMYAKCGSIDGASEVFRKLPEKDGDSSHPQSTNIYEMLQDMIERLKKAGYVPEKSEVLLDIDEEEKETALSLHSEKLAIAFGLISTNPGTTIRVVKNLRVCSDCHTATKIISKLYNREIIVRDRNRFHRFQDGSCSCKDFW
ncbi:hypothetical protein ACE6H2_025442 [Prunus campanulata]